MPLESPPLPALTSLAEAYLTALEAPDGGLRLHGLLGPEAPVLWDERVVSRSAIAPEAFAAAHRAAALLDAGRRPRWGTLEFERFAAEGARGVAWFHCVDHASGTRLAIAFGVTTGDQGVQLDWAALARTPEPWDHATGRMMALADLTSPMRRHLPGVRSALDVGYYRLIAFDRPSLETLPGARFGCQAQIACCRADWRISLHADFQALIDAVPWETVAPEMAGTRLPVLPDGSLELKGPGESCRFLDSERRCTIHKAVGRAVFPDCASFPFGFTATPSGVAVSTSGACPTVNAGIGPTLESRHEDLYYRLALTPLEAPRSFRITAEHETSWEDFRAAEAASRTLLDRRDLPLYRRLWLGHRLLTAWPAGVRAIDPAWLDERLPDLTDLQLQLVRLGLLGRVMDHFVSSEDPSWPLTVRHDSLMYADQLTELLRQFSFSRRAALAHDLLSAQTAMCFAYLIGLHQQALFPGQYLSAQAWGRLALYVRHGMLNQVLALDQRNGLRMFSRPDTAAFLLGYAD